MPDQDPAQLPVPEATPKRYTYHCPTGHHLFPSRGVAECDRCGTVFLCKDGTATDISTNPRALVAALGELFTVERILQGEIEGLKYTMQRWVEAQEALATVVTAFRQRHRGL